ncbi:hypothetical protein [Algoriphagus sp. CAU 1675]|uniref:hypothetical protein n=1 Tax=Algoriphagus sp. CAU 1675 TaxID=3032597 RepID=UPI0023DB76D4|nr:hypothetical protein [Algoriphagus sp. CAU 1675]MDF2157647.1 hypothetical protein [Algoriphagus sp. CAU 1675]
MQVKPATRDLDQERLIQHLKVLLNRGRGISGELGFFGKNRFDSENKYLYEGNCEIQREVDVYLFQLDFVIHLQMGGDVFAAGFGVLLIIVLVFTVVHGHFHSTVHVFFPKTDFGFHFHTHAKMGRLRHPDG